MLNAIWLALILISVLYAAWFGDLELVGAAALRGAKSAVVDVVIPLVGAMALFLGLMRVAQAGGLLYWITRALSPILRRLFPDVPPDHPAMGAIVMNIASNVLGLGNAATPFGLKAMIELQKLNAGRRAASDSMVLFLAINASSVALIPTGVIALREALGSEMASAIWLPTLLATSASTTVAVSAAMLLRRTPWFRLSDADEHQVAESSEGVDWPHEGDALSADEEEEEMDTSLPDRPRKASWGARFVVFGFLALLAIPAVRFFMNPGMPALDILRKGADVFLPVFIAGLLLFGITGRVRVYEAAVEGAREALDVAVRIVPFLVMILAAIAMFRASGALDQLEQLIHPLTAAIGFPGEALPMALLRPLSGSGAYGIMVEIMQSEGPDSFVGLLVGSLQGSTETTFYVLTLYLGAARIRDARHALPVCLSGDLAGLIVATAACHMLFS